MKKLILGTAALALTAGLAYAGSHSVVRMAPKAPTLRGTFLTMQARLMGSSVNWATSFARGPN